MELSRSLDSTGNRRGGLFHPFELAFSGFSGSGKTTLLEQVAGCLGKKYRLGYLKHDAHGFEIDYPGKDTWRLRQAGASLVRITSQTNHAMVSRLETGAVEEPCYYQGCDCVLVEGYKNSALPKVAVLDREGRLERAIQTGEMTNVIAYVYPDKDPESLDGFPRFHRDDIGAVVAFVDGFFEKRAWASPLYGLILAGGESRRMGEEKALLAYHGCSQVEHLAGLLAPICAATYLSRRPDQVPVATGNAMLPVILDTFLEMGPLGGVLSALRAFPHAARWVVACGPPWLNKVELEALVAARNPFRRATAFLQSDGEAEPLCTIYEPKAYPAALRQLGEGISSLRNLLHPSVSILLKPNHLETLRSLDTSQEFHCYSSGQSAAPF